MSFSQFKLDFFYLRKACFVYRKPFKYFKYKYLIAPKILAQPKIFDKLATQDNLSVHILTGHHHLVMLIWSLASFYKVTHVIGELHIHSDGTLDSSDKNLIYHFFPSAKIIESDYFVKKHIHQLAQYPLVKEFRLNHPEYFLLKKLIDPYFISSKPIHLIIDSDLLWFNQPLQLEKAIKNNAPSSLMMGNNGHCYVYFKNKQKVSHDLASYNSGIVLYHKDNFSLSKLEDYFNYLDVSQPSNQHFIEQVGYAYCLKYLDKLDPDKYIINPRLELDTVIKHYTSPRRPLFYIEGIPNLKL